MDRTNPHFDGHTRINSIFGRNMRIKIDTITLNVNRLFCDCHRILVGDKKKNIEILCLISLKFSLKAIGMHKVAVVSELTETKLLSNQNIYNQNERDKMTIIRNWHWYQPKSKKDTRILIRIYTFDYFTVFSNCGRYNSEYFWLFEEDCRYIAFIGHRDCNANSHDSMK